MNLKTIAHSELLSKNTWEAYSPRLTLNLLPSIIRFLEYILPKQYNFYGLNCGSGKYLTSSYIENFLPNLKLIDLDQLKLERPFRHRSYVCAYFHNLPFPNESFDVLISLFTLLYSPNEKIALSEWKDTLKPNGIGCFILHSPYSQLITIIKQLKNTTQFNLNKSNQLIKQLKTYQLLFSGYNWSRERQILKTALKRDVFLNYNNILQALEDYRSLLFLNQYIEKYCATRLHYTVNSIELLFQSVGFSTINVYCIGKNKKIFNATKYSPSQTAHDAWMVYVEN